MTTVKCAGMPVEDVPHTNMERMINELRELTKTRSAPLSEAEPKGKLGTTSEGFPQHKRVRIGET